MRFDWVNILATVIFVSIVVTLILAVASYFAYKVREARRPAPAALQESATPTARAAVERRLKPRLFRRSHDARVEWKHIAIYVPIVVLAVIVGAFAIWSFLEKQSLAIDPAPLPKVTLITGNP